LGGWRITTKVTEANGHQRGEKRGLLGYLNERGDGECGKKRGLDHGGTRVGRSAPSSDYQKKRGQKSAEREASSPGGLRKDTGKKSEELEEPKKLLQ